MAMAMVVHISRKKSRYTSYQVHEKINPIVIVRLKLWPMAMPPLVAVQT